MSILRQYVAADAMYDADIRFDAPRCTEGTRKAVQEDFMTWAQLPILDLALEQLRLLLWMTGAAGTGKSAIFQTIAEKADKQNLLAASFFFSYKYPARDGMLIPTLTYQIAVKIPAIQEYLGIAITSDPFIFSKALEKQLDVLIIEPLTRVLEKDPSAAVGWPKLIIIDGLDECKSLPPSHLRQRVPGSRNLGLADDEAHSTEKIASTIDDSGGEQRQLEIITLLHRALVTRRLPFRVALASRPDMPMRGFFSSDSGSTCTRKIDLNITYKPGDDIRLFLRSSFERIRAKHDVELGWPGEEVVETLVNNASGQFVYADTVIKFVDGPSCEPTSNLKVIMEIAQNTATSQKLTTDPSAANPYAPLDDMYAAIFNRCPAPKESAMAIHLFLRISIGINSLPDRAMSANEFNTFLQYRSSDVARVFGKLHSLVSVPLIGDSKKGYNLHHKSLQDFLYSPRRCGLDLHISLQALLERISIQLLRSSGTFHIRDDPEAQPCTPNCPYVLHIDGCVEPPRLWVEDESGILYDLFTSNHTDIGILQNGYQATMLQTVLDSMDADSWTLERVTRKQNGQLNSVYNFVHNTTFGCRWFRCGDICSRWRRAIRQECLRKNWKVSPFSYRISQSPVHHPPITERSDGFTLRAWLMPPP
ncbi:hypothetical protein FA15DRAFT_670443 [Coprinopsis marcescibilis]|uniref:Nephrocystin 3-like N-terminal domain-containing protein n=1 Tax=Coprinopsis marcescibilis TaxID=230819 RepID=A0A5C3KSN1_COPMA|nr:hypothetical protein FA15DRAFT_670443 [Coprinopsis marcescibilis]